MIELLGIIHLVVGQIDMLKISYSILLPEFISWSGEISEIFVWSSFEAASSIPCDSMPLSFRGSRFAMIIIFLFFSSSSV